MLNWNGKRWLRDCFDALEKQAAAELWLVDNGSRDDSVEFVRQQFPAVRILELGQNVGFGRAYNRAIAACRAPLTALLNNDTVVQPGWLDALVAEARASAQTAAIGGKLLHLNNPAIVNHAGGQITVLGSAYDQRLGQPEATRDSDPRSVSCVSGAGMLLRREAFLAVGGFDETYFAYFEDADLCWRLHLRGYGVRYVPAARALHAYGGSTGGSRNSPLRVEHCQANRLQNMLKNLETRTLVWAVPASVAFDSYRLLGFLAARNVAAARAYVRGTRRFLGLIPHILEERRRVQLTRLRSDRALMSEGVLAGVRQSSKEWRRINSLT